MAVRDPHTCLHHALRMEFKSLGIAHSIAATFMLSVPKSCLCNSSTWCIAVQLTGFKIPHYNFHWYTCLRDSNQKPHEIVGDASEATRCLAYTHQHFLPVNALPLPPFSDPLCQTRPLCELTTVVIFLCLITNQRHGPNGGWEIIRKIAMLS